MDRPIINSLLDTDFYKFLMLQFIWRHHPDVRATFGLHNRAQSVQLLDHVNLGELQAQLDHARNLRFTESELTWLANNRFAGDKPLFDPEFIRALSYFRLPEYELCRNKGQIELRFHGLWAETTMWEIPALAIVNHIYARSEHRNFMDEGRLWSAAEERLDSKIERLQRLADDHQFKIADFGTRRRRSFSWQRHCINALHDALPDNFIGTSNARHAMDTRVEPIGTSAHELPMVYAALADNDAELYNAPYAVMHRWSEMYQQQLRIMLPDTYGTADFLARAPDELNAWTGARPDSRPPIEGAEELIAWWQSRGENPQDKLVILSDGMTIDTIESSVRALSGRVKLSIGWGTSLTNDFAGLPGYNLPKISLVCKVIAADGRLAVKLSDVAEKNMGDSYTLARYKRVFHYPQAGE